MNIMEFRNFIRAMNKSGHTEDTIFQKAMDQLMKDRYLSPQFSAFYRSRNLRDMVTNEIKESGGYRPAPVQSSVKSSFTMGSHLAAKGQSIPKSSSGGGSVTTRPVVGGHVTVDTQHYNATTTGTSSAQADAGRATSMMMPSRHLPAPQTLSSSAQADAVDQGQHDTQLEYVHGTPSASNGGSDGQRINDTHARLAIGEEPGRKAGESGQLMIDALNDTAALNPPAGNGGSAGGQALPDALDDTAPSAPTPTRRPVASGFWGVVNGISERFIGIVAVAEMSLPYEAWSLFDESPESVIHTIQTSTVREMRKMSRQAVAEGRRNNQQAAFWHRLVSGRSDGEVGKSFASQALINAAVAATKIDDATGKPVSPATEQKAA